MKHVRLFKTTAEFEAAKETLAKPNIGLIEKTGKLHMVIEGGGNDAPSNLPMREDTIRLYFAPNSGVVNFYVYSLSEICFNGEDIDVPYYDTNDGIYWVSSTIYIDTNKYPYLEFAGAPYISTYDDNALVPIVKVEVGNEYHKEQYDSCSIYSNDMTEVIFHDGITFDQLRSMYIKSNKLGEIYIPDSVVTEYTTYIDTFNYGNGYSKNISFTTSKGHFTLDELNHNMSGDGIWITCSNNSTLGFRLGY